MITAQMSGWLRKGAILVEVSHQPLQLHHSYSKGWTLVAMCGGGGGGVVVIIRWRMLGERNWVLVWWNEWVRIRMSMEGKIVWNVFSRYTAANVEIIRSLHHLPYPRSWPLAPALSLILARTLLKSRDIDISCWGSTSSWSTSSSTTCEHNAAWVPSIWSIS